MKFKSALSGFFDRKKVTSAVDKATRRVLSRFGAFVRTAARSSIRRRKSVSKPGQAPTNWTGLLKKFLFFSFVPSKRSVVIGPARINKSSKDAPELLEKGGTAKRRDRNGRRRTVRYRARPYMGPAFEKEQKQLPKLWRNSVR
ncbi:MAG: hypothetical protein ACE5KM_14670 [Planctomycetaceae bacterium]